MVQWIREVSNYWEWFLLFSGLCFLVSILMLPIIVARIPTDYFVRKKRVHDSWANLPKALRFFVVGAKQLLGALLVLTGVVMLVIPGQGILTIFVGLMLIKFPGKYRLLRWFAQRPGVSKALNWMRARKDRPPLNFGDDY